MTRIRATLGVATIAAAMLLISAPAAAQDASITVEPSTDLADGDTVTVTVSGFPANSTEFVSGQCVTPIEDPLAQCNTANIVPVALDADGGATYEVTVNTGAIGSGTCGPGGDDCVILIGSLSQPQNAAAPITFADPDAEVVDDAAEAEGDGTAQPTAVNTGDLSGSSNSSTLLLAAAAGLVFLAGGAFALRQRGVRG